MFAIALWDSRKRRLLLARDRVGKKPLYFAADGQRIVFGSELKALLAAGNLSRQVDPEALSDYFSFGYIPAPKTIYRAVRKLLPGHYLVVSGMELREVCYWDFGVGKVENRREDEWCEILRHELCEATRVRLMSEVPLGAFLSGGVDSSAVVAANSRLLQRPVPTGSLRISERDTQQSENAPHVRNFF